MTNLVFNFLPLEEIETNNYNTLSPGAEAFKHLTMKTLCVYNSLMSSYGIALLKKERKKTVRADVESL